MRASDGDPDPQENHDSLDGLPARPPVRSPAHSACDLIRESQSSDEVGVEERERGGSDAAPTVLTAVANDVAHLARLLDRLTAIRVISARFLFPVDGKLMECERIT